MSDTQTHKSETLEHLGLVAGMFDELGIGDLVDELVPQDLCQRKVSVGQALKAMVLNGLGFANRRLYLMPEFFRNKPTERLVGAGISPEHLNDDALGKALDTLYAFGLTELYRLIARQAAERLGLGGTVTMGHLDTTSFHVDGRYNSEGDDDDDFDEEAGVIRVSKGYSRDHRDDLNQVVLELITESRANLPMMMRPLSGNASDKTSFKDAIERHVGQLRGDDGTPPSMVVLDSAGFTRECLAACQRQGLGWVMSVPSTVGEARRRLEDVDPEKLRPLMEGYRYSAFWTTYAGVKQRWLVIYSEAARKRAAKRVDKQLLKQGDEERKAFDELRREAFHCPQDARRALAAFRETLGMLEVHGADVIERRHYKSAGKPAADAVPESIGYHLDGALAAPIAVRERRLIRRSCFIVATNELDEGVLEDPEVLRAYKGQSSKVERGFRFLKDPMFLASTLYLKRVERVMALLMVMTVCLLVYAALEYRIRQTLAEHEESVPDQKGKPTRRPTAKWIFELFMDVHLLTITAEKTIRRLVLNLREELKTLLKLMGPTYMELYS
ncbi:MAG: IS1634 family transposase [Rubrobacteraceae bacterium]|jgi:transposase|nr:IS1634 family transposase [Rubrobacteraceae bacterium]